MAGRRLVRAAAIVAMAVQLMPAPASAEGLTHVVGVANATIFTPGTEIEVRILEGDSLILVNHDYPGEQSEHDLTHAAQVPLFETGVQIRPAETAEVFGVPELEPGTYPFVCAVHPTTMEGTLVVLPSPV